MKKVLESLRKETDALERRNIDFINTLSEAQNKEIQAMSDLYSMSTGRGLHSGRAGESGLPSLVDVTKCTSEKVSTCHVKPMVFAVKCIAVIIMHNKICHSKGVCTYILELV